MSRSSRRWAMERPTRILGLAFAVATLLSACSSAASPSAPPGATAPTVDGRTYLSTGIHGATLVPGTRVTLSFKDGNLNASGGCNSMSGPYTITGGHLSATRMATTEMGCDQPRMRQDEWLARLLGDATITLAGDDLTLEEGSVRLTLLDRKVASPDQPITGTRWVLDGIISGATASSVPAGVTASIRIVDGRIDVQSGCNTGSGTVEVTADTLTFGAIALSKKACEPAAAAVESAVTAVLAGSARYTIDADALTLSAGSAGLTFRATP